jgi:hypothetical protein
MGASTLKAHDEAERLNQESEDEGSFYIEKMGWISLFESARLSIAHKTAICLTEHNRKVE